MQHLSVTNTQRRVWSTIRAWFYDF